MLLLIITTDPIVFTYLRQAEGWADLAMCVPCEAHCTPRKRSVRGPCMFASLDQAGLSARRQHPTSVRVNPNVLIRVSPQLPHTTPNHIRLCFSDGGREGWADLAMRTNLNKTFWTHYALQRCEWFHAEPRTPGAVWGE